MCRECIDGVWTFRHWPAWLAREIAVKLYSTNGVILGVIYIYIYERIYINVYVKCAAVLYIYASGREGGKKGIGLSGQIFRAGRV